MNERQVAISQLVVSREAWPRFNLDEERVELFKELLASGEELPSIEVVPYRSDRYLVADGVHRANAANRAGRTEIDVVILSLEDGETPVACALRRGLETATKTALPLTTAERRQATIKLATAHPEMSHRAIAKLVGVSHDSVDRWLRPEQERDRADDTDDDEGDEPEPPYEAPITADVAARQLVTGLALLYESRGIIDMLAPARMGQHLANAYQERFGNQALKEAIRFASWANRAVAVLNATRQQG
jgi:ParB-like chromosome segregation protein Spo0J